MEIPVYIEIEQFSNKKYELNKETNFLELDRILPYPYFYPYAYGFIPNTLAMDGDDLDALIITNKPLKLDRIYNTRIIGVLLMEDEKGMDEKIICVLSEDYDDKTDITVLSENDRHNIHWFFSNYKSNTPGKWSSVKGYESKEFAINLYNKYLLI
jgi:inorganic pyrophosphatase